MSDPWVMNSYIRLIMAIIKRAIRDMRNNSCDATLFLKGEAYDWIDLLAIPISYTDWVDWIEDGCPDEKNILFYFTHNQLYYTKRELIKTR